MRQCILIILMTLSFQLLPAQKYVFSGTVYDEKTHEALAQVNVSGSKANVSVVTNEDGFFILKTDVMPADLQISHLGYKTKRVKVSERNNDVMKIMLTPATIQLKEVVVWTNDPEELMFTAIRKIPDNYSKQPILYNCFYRETAMKRQHHIYIAEGVLDMYKTSYKYNIGRDKVAIRKGRRLLSPKQSDTLGIKVNGGPVLPVFLDVVKNTELLLNAEELSKYNFTMEFPATINDRQQFVVSISPKIPQPYALYYGKFYIDRETLMRILRPGVERIGGTHLLGQGQLLIIDIGSDNGCTTHHTANDGTHTYHTTANHHHHVDISNLRTTHGMEANTHRLYQGCHLRRERTGRANLLPGQDDIFLQGTITLNAQRLVVLTCVDALVAT